MKVPVSTYRLQLHGKTDSDPGFTFEDAGAIAPYLSELGVTHVYSSPYLQAAPGSMHGYDVVDHQSVNEELGGAAAHEHFSQTLGENGLGQVLDIVPNHMAIGKQNRFWWDILENGSSSQYASFFDIDWHPQEERLRDKVLVPILGDQYGKEIEAGHIRIKRSGSTFQVEAAGQTLPVAPTSLPLILSPAADLLPRNHANLDVLRFLSNSFNRLPTPSYEDRPTVLARFRDTVVLQKLVQRLCSEDTTVCKAIDQAVEHINQAHDVLDEFLNAQNYRLSYWKTADQQLGYRRFFDVNSLIGLRMEREHVFRETHALILEWLRSGVLDGVRVDHPDGLRDPKQYFQRLREAAPEAWIVGEKILEPGEYLPESWPIEGTSGYDFLNAALNLLLDREGVEKLTGIYGDFTGQPTSFPPIAHDKKLAVTQEALGSDVNRLVTVFVEICEKNRNHRDYTRTEIRRALRELAGCFAVYRSYVNPARDEITDTDRKVIHCAVQCGKNNRPDLPAGLFDFLHDVLTMRCTGRKETEFVLRFQQFTSPVMAKGVEDTAFYCFNRLVAMCEVGGDPAKPGKSPAEFHDYQLKMQSSHPFTLTTLSTHDTKRSDDVRARLAVLSEIPEEFAAWLQTSTAMTAQYKTEAWPDPNTEYFLYQTLLGAWPINAERTKTYMSKAVHEAKQQTSWVANNKPFEEALERFIDSILADQQFTEHVRQFAQRILRPGRINSLAQTLIKHTAPGVPDLYQGGELWDLTLVDPDNRRPVDYELRHRLLRELPERTTEELSHCLEQMDDPGATKLKVIQQCLHLRRAHRDWFGPDAAYTPVAVTGPGEHHAVAYLRGDHVLTVVSVRSVRLHGDWQDSALQLPDGTWRNLFTGQGGLQGSLLLKDVFQAFPVALLVREESEGRETKHA